MKKLIYILLSSAISLTICAEEITMKWISPKTVQIRNNTNDPIYYYGHKTLPFHGIESPVIGVRWNVAQREWDEETKQREERECVGMPSSRGNPVWFVLPEELLNKESDAWRAIERTLQFE